MTQLFLFIFGASLGSFINVLAWRYDPKKSFWSVFQEGPNRSACPHCNQVLAWHQLIPIVSFIIQAGRCRGCHQPISWQYPIVELLMAGLAVGLWQFISPITIISHISFIAILLLLLTFVTIALIDLRTTIIPDELTVTALVLTLISLSLRALAKQSDDQIILSSSLVGLLVGGGLLGGLWALGHGRWMGLGDGKLGAVLGLWLGFPGIWLVLAVAFISGTIVAGGLLLGRLKTLKDQLSFGPFLVLGGLATFFLRQWFEGWWQGVGL